MKYLFVVSFLLYSNISAFSQSTATLQQKIDENERFISNIKSIIYQHSKSVRKESKNLKALQFTYDAYYSQWNLDSLKWDTISRVTYFSDEIASGVTEFQAYVEINTPNGFIKGDSLYMILNSNLNWFKIPFTNLSDPIETEVLRFRFDSINNKYQLISSQVAIINSSNDIIQRYLRFHNRVPAPPSGFLTFDSTDYIYDNGSLDYYLRTSYYPFSGTYTLDSFAISSNNSFYPIKITRFSGPRTSYFERQRELIDYNNNNDVIRVRNILEQFGQFDLVSVITTEYLNGLPIVDSNFNGNGVLQDLRNYYYNANNDLDSLRDKQMIGLDSGNVQFRRNFEYDSLSRIKSKTSYLYKFNGGGISQAERTEYVYTPYFTNLIETKETIDKYLLMPNPVRNWFSIKGSFSEIRAVIRDVSGAIVKEVIVIPMQPVNVSELPSGIYFIKLEDTKVLKMLKD